MPSTIWMIQRTMFMGTSLQVEASSCRLEALETSTYSGQGPGPPISPASPITAAWRVERLAPARHHLHPPTGSPSLPAATRCRDESLRVRGHGCAFAPAGPAAAGLLGEEISFGALARERSARPTPLLRPPGFG